MNVDPKVQFYNDIMAKLTEVNQTYTIHMRIPDCDEHFFKENGCSTEEYDFGVITTVIKRNTL